MVHWGHGRSLTAQQTEISNRKLAGKLHRPLNWLPILTLNFIGQVIGTTQRRRRLRVKSWDEAQASAQWHFALRRISSASTLLPSATDLLYVCLVMMKCDMSVFASETFC